jgi:hypothetical protein
LDITDLYVVSIPKIDDLHFFVIETDSIGGISITKNVTTVYPVHRAMGTRDRGVVDNDVVIDAAPNRDLVTVEFKTVRLRVFSGDRDADARHGIRKLTER